MSIEDTLMEQARELSAKLGEEVPFLVIAHNADTGRIEFITNLQDNSAFDLLRDLTNSMVEGDGTTRTVPRQNS